MYSVNMPAPGVSMHTLVVGARFLGATRAEWSINICQISRGEVVAKRALTSHSMPLHGHWLLGGGGGACM